MEKFILLEYRQIFEDKPLSVEDYIRDLDFSDLIKASTFLLAVSNLGGIYNELSLFLKRFFSINNAKLAQKVFEKIKELESKQYAKVIILNPEGGLRLIEEVLKLPEKKQSQVKEETFEEMIFKALLVINQEIVIKQDSIFSFIESAEKDEIIPGYILGATLSYSEFVNCNKQKLIVNQLIKAVFFFKFCEEELPKHLMEFLKIFEVNSWEEYLTTLLPAIYIFNRATEEEPKTIVFNSTQSAQFEKAEMFFEKLAVKDLDIEERSFLDFILIRNNPFIRYKEGFRLLNEVFLIEKLFKSLYFQFLKINGTLPEGFIKANFRSFYCDEFSEKFLFRSFVKLTFKNNYIQIDSDQFKKAGIDGEPDYYIRNGNKIFLFENKDISLNAEIKTSSDVNLILNELYRKLHTDPNTGKGTGLLQLTKNIERILSGNFFDTGYKPKNVKIYPILVLHERIFNTEGINYFLNKWFLEELKKIEKKGFNISKIKPLVVISIDTFVYFHEILQVKETNLENLLELFYLKTNPKKVPKNEAEAMEKITSFSVFVENKLNLKNHGPKIFLEYGASLIN